MIGCWLALICYRKVQRLIIDHLEPTFCSSGGTGSARSKVSHALADFSPAALRVVSRTNQEITCLPRDPCIFHLHKIALIAQIAVQTRDVRTDLTARVGYLHRASKSGV